jgi:plasmid segregation protein ParM
MEKKNNVGADKNWVIALDIGYSAVKGMSKNMVFSFPSFAQKADTDSMTVGKANPTDIQYKDASGVIWDVGDMAISMLSQNDSRSSEETLYSRNRYHDPMFLVIARVGMALGMRVNEYGNPNGKSMVLQTGLPPKFIKGDSPILRKVLSGTHDFYVRIGDEDWKHYRFELKDSNINIMGQPMGSFFSASFNDDCSEIENVEKFFNNDLLIFDGGFGTLDTFEVKRRRIDAMQTFDNLGMKAVLHKVTEILYKDYGVEVSVHSIQNNLKTGYVKKFDPDTMSTKKIPINEILEKANREICMNAINQIKTLYNNLIDCRYLLVTGGTGAAWFDIMKKYFAGMEDLEVIGANQNTDLPQIFSNVRGYYLFQVAKLMNSGK